MNFPSLRHARPRFRLGRILATPAALDALKGVAIPPIYLLMRHVCGDCGELCDTDRQQNEVALAIGSRLLLSYSIRGNRQIWVVTEADHSTTTVLLPDEY